MKRLISTTCLCMLFVSSIALAEDLNPPEWWGWHGTTWQGWEFDTPDPGPMSPDWGEYLPSTYLIVTPGPGMGWLEYDRPYQYAYDPENPDGGVVGLGVWELSGSIDAIVDNWPEPNPEKCIWIQITWRPQDVGEFPIIYLSDPLGGQIGPVTEPINVIPLGPDWIHSTYEIVLGYNPPDEFIHIEGTINVDELVIDTWCVPEPATVGLLGLGALILLRKRRA